MSDIHPPILRRLMVEGTPERAFSAFADRIGMWWPKAFSANGDALAGVNIEPMPGGRIFETGLDDVQMAWGAVAAIEPGARLVMDWWLGLPEGKRTVVEIVFLPSQGGTEMVFVHRSWTEEITANRAKFDHAEGWDMILRAYRDYARWYAARIGPEATTVVVAARRLLIVTDAAVTAVEIRFFAPQEADGSWGCRYEIDWPERKRSFVMFGVDAVQALHLAMCMVGSEVYGSRYHAEGTLVFGRPGSGYGFPVAAAERGDLIGDDRVFF